MNVEIKKIYSENKKVIDVIALIVIPFLVIAIILLIQKYRKKLILSTSKGMKTYTFKDANTSGVIESLHPLFREPLADFIQEVESPAMGELTVSITSGVRSFEKQKELASDGTSPASVSLHNFGFAADINVNGKDRNGNTVSLRKSSPLKDWQPIVDIGNSKGLINGGTFSNTYDPVHFQYNVGKSAKDLLALYESGKVNNGYVIV